MNHNKHIVLLMVDMKYNTVISKGVMIQEGQGGFESILEGLSNKLKYMKSQEKFYPNLHKMFKNDHLKLLSGLNDYLIFKKI